MERQKSLYGRYEAYLQRTYTSCGKGSPKGLCGQMGKQVLLCYQKLEGQLGRAYRVLRVPHRDQENNLYHQPYREPERQDQEVHQEQAVLPDR